MIATLRGEVAALLDGGVVVEVAGVGYRLIMPASAGVQLGENRLWHVHTHVREDALSLYGFIEARHKELFLLLVGVQGIGPSLAHGMVYALGVPTIAAAVESGDVATLKRAPKVGKTGAEKIILALRGKLARFLDTQLPLCAITGAPALLGGKPAAAVSALCGLGYKEQAARAAVATVASEMAEDASEQSWVRAALKQAGR